MAEPAVLCGTERDGVEPTIARMRELTDGLVVRHHDLHDLVRGRVHRRIGDGRRQQRTVLDLAHGCVGCTLRKDVLPTLAAPAGTVRRVVLRLRCRRVDRTAAVLDWLASTAPGLPPIGSSPPVLGLPACAGPPRVSQTACTTPCCALLHLWTR